MGEVWFRNPDNYIRECIELGESMLAWDRGYLVKKSIDPNRFADLYYPASTQYRMLAVGDQGTAELRRGQTLENPAAVYPTWEYGQDIAVLETMLECPAGDNPVLCEDDTKPADERPVVGQEHRVVVIRVPPASTGPGRKILGILSELQSEHPDAIIHVHGLYSYRAMFGLGFRSVDSEPRILARKGKVTLPSGKEVTYERAATTPHWVRVCGYSPADLEIPRNRCMFNMRSAKWAAENYATNIKFRSVRGPRVDPDAKNAIPQVTKSHLTVDTVAQPGDKFACDVCSLQDTCKYYRAGSVCSLPDSEPASLAKMFKSRNADQIVEGLAELLARQVQRLERGLALEDVMEDMDPEVSKAINAVFANGVKLAKLRDPKLSGGPLVGINLNVPQGVLNEASQREMASAAMQALEAQGIKREDITPDMVMRVLAPALEAGEDIPDAEVVHD